MTRHYFKDLYGLTPNASIHTGWLIDQLDLYFWYFGTEKHTARRGRLHPNWYWSLGWTN